jgi:hypothetical protein
MNFNCSVSIPAKGGLVNNLNILGSLGSGTSGSRPSQGMVLEWRDFIGILYEQFDEQDGLILGGRATRPSPAGAQRYLPPMRRLLPFSRRG